MLPLILVPQSAPYLFTYNVLSSTPKVIPCARLLTLLEWLEMYKNYSPKTQTYPLSFLIVPPESMGPLGLQDGRSDREHWECTQQIFAELIIFQTSPLNTSHQISCSQASRQFLHPSHFCLTPFQSGPEPSSGPQPEKRWIQSHLWDLLFPLRFLFLLPFLYLNPFSHLATPSSSIFNGSSLIPGLTPNFSTRHFTTPSHSNTIHAMHP